MLYFFMATLAFVHGFMGSKASFKEFPDDVKNQFGDINVEYFEYNTSGQFTEVVELLKSWLATKSNVIILAHSMGGPLSIEASLGNGNVKGIICFDSPIFGLNPQLVTTAINRVGQSVSGKKSWLGFAAAAVAVTAAVAFRKHIQEGITSRMDFLSPLWSTDRTHTFKELIQSQVKFKGFYIEVDGVTFTRPPPNDHNLFTKVSVNSTDAIEGHMHMFQDSEHYNMMLMETVLAMNEMM
jgi:pimeloyl-ACP methyl ester carboxylesterase